MTRLTRHPPVAMKFKIARFVKQPEKIIGSILFGHTKNQQYRFKIKLIFLTENNIPWRSHRKMKLSPSLEAATSGTECSEPLAL